MAMVPRRPRLVLPLAAAVALACPGLARPQAAAPIRPDQVVRVSGTGTALGPVALLARAFEAANPDVAIRILPSVGSSGAIKAVAGGALDLGFSGRALHPGEAALPISGLELARTPFVLAAGPRGGMTTLDLPTLARIYRGDLDAWPNGERIRLVLRPAADADTLYLRSLSPEMAAAMELALARPGMLMAATNQDCDALVARTPGALGPSTLAQILTEATTLRPLAWGGVAPTLENLAAGRYPLWKPIVAVLPRQPSPAAARFLAYVRSPAGRRALEASGCTPSQPPAGG